MIRQPSTLRQDPVPLVCAEGPLEREGVLGRAGMAEWSGNT